MLLEYNEEVETTMVWYQGKFDEFIMESKEKYIIVRVEWDEKCMNP